MRRCAMRWVTKAHRSAHAVMQLARPTVAPKLPPAEPAIATVTTMAGGQIHGVGPLTNLASAIEIRRFVSGASTQPTLVVAGLAKASHTTRETSTLVPTKRVQHGEAGTSARSLVTGVVGTGNHRGKHVRRTGFYPSGIPLGGRRPQTLPRDRLWQLGATSRERRVSVHRESSQVPRSIVLALRGTRRFAVRRRLAVRRKITTRHPR